MAIINYKPTTPSRRNMSARIILVFQKLHRKRAFWLLWIKNPVVIATVESQYVTEAAETEENTVSSILNVQNTAFQLLYKH